HVRATDQAGNQTIGTVIVTVDRTGPTVASFAPPDGGCSGSSPINFVVTFNEAVTGVSASGFTVTGGTVGTVTGSGTTYTLPVTPTAQGAVTAQVTAGAAQNSCGSGNTISNTASVIYDTTAPTVAVSAPSSTCVGTGASVTYTVTYSDANTVAVTL